MSYLTSRARHVLLWLADRPTGQCPSNALLADEFAVSERTIQLALSELETSRLVDVVREKPAASNNHTGRVLVILWENAAEDISLPDDTAACTWRACHVDVPNRPLCWACAVPEAVEDADPDADPVPFTSLVCAHCSTRYCEPGFCAVCATYVDGDDQ